MAVTYNKNNQTSGLNSDTRLNTELTAIQTAFVDCVSRSGGAPNAMAADFDLGGNDILNAGTVNCSDFLIDGQPLASLADLTAQAAAAAASETAAAASAAAAAASAATINLPAIGGASAGDLLEANATPDGYQFTTPTTNATPNAIAKRDGSGRMQTATPSAGNDCATKASSEGYTDSAVATHESDFKHIALLSNTSITAVSTIDLATVFSDNTGYKYYRIVVESPQPTALDALGIRFSLDGSTFRSTSGDYEYSFTRSGPAHSTNAVTNVTTSATAMYLTDNAVVSEWDNLAIAIIDIISPATSDEHPIYWKVIRPGTAGGTPAERFDGIGHFDASTGVITGFQLGWDFSSTTFAAQGNVKVYGSSFPF